MDSLFYNLLDDWLTAGEALTELADDPAKRTTLQAGLDAMRAMLDHAGAEVRCNS